MRKLISSGIFLGVSLVTSVFAAVTVKTNNGVVYNNAEVKSAEKGAVILKHDGGVAKVLLKDLSKQTRQALRLKATMETAKADFEKHIRGFKKSLFDLDVSYAGHLSNLEKTAQKAGLLDQVLEVRKELKEFRSGAQAEYKYDKLKKMRAIYDGERMKRRNRIVDALKLALGSYQIELKGIAKSLTVADKIDEAIEVKKEEDRVVAMLANRKQALDDLGVFSTAGVASGESDGKVAMTKDSATSKRGAAGSLTFALVSKGKPFENSLGMRFVPVPIVGGESDGQGVLFSVWETRVEDYKAFLKKDRKRVWPKTEFRQTEDHPAVHVSLEDAEAFCLWLTEKEQKQGRLGKEQRYRLPTDHEWSCAVGVAKLEDAAMSPVLKKYKNMEIYPWGNGFPPPAKAGNFYGEECEKNPFQNGRVPIEGYNDGFDRTSPVGSFEANGFGLYDLEGNVYEWCQSWYDPAKKANQVWRGGAWLLSKASNLTSASRAGGVKGFKTPGLGFRVVLDAGGGGGQSAVDTSSVKPVFKIDEAKRDAPFENKMGMRFVPVPITGGVSDGQRVLFSIWETRVRDYAAFIKKNRDINWPKLPYKQTKDDPAGYTSWDNAMSFAAWLTEQGRKNGELNQKQEYRLPTDHEWSCAVGLGGMEDAEASPVSKNKSIPNEFPWGKGYPPPKGAGNYNGEEGKGVLPRQAIPDYDDGFVYTSPAGTYIANQFGLYDLGGNVWEWVQDWFNPNQQKKRVFRGAAYIWESEPALLSSNRGLSEPGKQIQMVGFRVVIAPIAE